MSRCFLLRNTLQLQFLDSELALKIDTVLIQIFTLRTVKICIMSRLRDGKLPTVYICVEIKNRELDSQVLLAKSLANRGYRCILGTHASIFSVLRAKRIKSGIFLDKGTLPASRMSWIKTKCDSIVIMDQELGPTLENPSEHLGDWNSRIYPGADEFIDKYLCVGPKVYNAALHRFKSSNEKVVLTGWPRVSPTA